MESGNGVGFKVGSAVFLLVGLCFYLMTHWVMDAQGLPLYFNLLPAK